MIFVGIDPGISGAVAAVDERGEVRFLSVLEGLDGTLDVHDFCETLDRLYLLEEPLDILLEKVGAMPGQGVSSTFKFGTTYGMLQGALAAKRFRFRTVTPQAWTKVMLAGEDKSDKKNRAKLVARRLFPTQPLTRTDRSRTVDSGLADALLIAEYGRRTHA